MAFNPNELVLERIRSVEEYDPSTNELQGRYTQIEEPSLQTSADGTDVTDAMGAKITTFYNAQTGTFGFSNSLFSLELVASQFGAEKIVASADNKIQIPVSEVIPVGADHTVTLKYKPVGVKGSEVKYVKVINTNNTFGKTYEVNAVAGDGKFTLDADNKKITLPDEVASGRVFVNYTRESEAAVQVDKTTDSVPKVKSLLIHAIFHDPCDTNLTYAGAIYCPRAQVDPSSIELNLTSDGKHAVTYNLQKSYCDDDAKLFSILVSED